MMKEKKITPPKLAQRFLQWYCKASLLEDLEGDLNEYFERNCKTKSVHRARFIYIIDVLKFLRPYTIRKFEFLNLLIHWVMIGSYVKTSGRNILRHKLFSTINIFGLAVSMSVGLIIIAMLMDVYTYDRFHTNHKKIYRIISRYQFLDNADNNFMATASVAAGKAIKETFSGVEDVAILKRGFNGDLQHEERKLPLQGFWANESFFSVFSFSLLQGNPATALKDPYSVVLTETSAAKLFGQDEAIGKTLLFNNASYTVTGIVGDVPHFSHMRFEILGSLSTKEIIDKNNNAESAWDNIWDSWVYVLIKEDVDLKTFKHNLDKLSETKDKTVKNTHIELRTQPLDEIVTGEQLGNQIGRTIGRTLTWVFTALAFVVILSACFNYTNLSIARSLRRSREIGIRKVIGARKAHVIGQFIAEAVIISLLSLVAAFFIFILIKPHFLDMHDDLRTQLLLEITPELVAYFVCFAVFIGIFSGFFPALFFAKINAIQVMKDVSAVGVSRTMTGRKALIVFQYCLSLMLILGTTILYQQYKHYTSFDLGFNTKNILNIPLKGNKAEILKKELSELPEITGISQSVIIPGVGNYWGSTVRNPLNPEDSAFLFANIVDEHYLPLHEYKLIAGRNFHPLPDSAEESEVIVNQATLKRFNLAADDPVKAIGQTLKVNGKELKIVGVMKDFQYGKADNGNAKEVMYRYSGKEVMFLNVKIHTADLPAAYEKIEALWKKLDDVHPFEAKFYDEAIETAFRGIYASLKLAGFIAFLAICIASLGLLGMVVFTTETRLKEISIRKVLGASEGRLIYLLARGFFILLAIAAAIALPVTYLFFDKVMLPKLANHISLDIIDGIMGVLAVMLIAGIMIGTQTIKAARKNPAEVLKSE